MYFNATVNSILLEMAIQSNNDIVYLSQLQNAPRNNASNYDIDSVESSFKRLTSRGFPKAMRNHFGAKVKYPIRIVVDDVKDEELVSREDASRYIPPTPGYITFYLHPYKGAANPLTPFLIGHNVGHTMQHVTYNGGFRIANEPYPFDDIVVEVIEDIINNNPEHPWFNKYYPGNWHNCKQGEGYIKILTPNLVNISEGFEEWVPNLVGLYMKYGRINFRVGSAIKIEQFIDQCLQNWVGKSIAIG
jgi:hypothetical protein